MSARNCTARLKGYAGVGRWIVSDAAVREDGRSPGVRSQGMVVTGQVVANSLGLAGPPSTSPRMSKPTLLDRDRITIVALLGPSSAPCAASRSMLPEQMAHQPLVGGHHHLDVTDTAPTPCGAFPRGLLEDQLVKREIGHRLPQPSVIAFQIPHPLRLMPSSDRRTPCAIGNSVVR